MSVLASLCEGETLMIGGKEVEVMGVISPEDFAKGRCFQDFLVEKSEPQSGPHPSARRPVSKPFCPPTSLRGDHVGPRPEEEVTYKPRHDPTAPGSRSISLFLHLFPKCLVSPSKFLNPACVTVRSPRDASSLFHPPVVQQQVRASCGRCGGRPPPERSPASTPEGGPDLSLRVCHGDEVQELFPPVT